MCVFLHSCVVNQPQMLLSREALRCQSTMDQLLLVLRSLPAQTCLMSWQLFSNGSDY